MLSDLDFTIYSGDVIAITGESGIGKSTLLKLLLGIYNPTAGSITVRDRKEHSAVLDAGAREIISYVPQGNFPMSGTIRDSVHFWQGETPDGEKLRKACVIAEADEMIRALEQGYDTRLGERGAGLSEGQLQRLAIARAVLLNPKILVMDDSTSAVDMETEYKIQQELKEVLKNRTTFIIAHRISSVKNADQILVLDHGEIAERGNHKELMAQGVIYYQMVMDQMASAVKV